MFKRFLVCLAVLSMVLAGCAQPTPTAAPKADPTAAQAPAQPTAVPATAAPAKRSKVVVMSWWDIATSKPLQELKAAFEAKNPDLELEFQRIPGAEYADKMLTTIAGGGEMPDVMMLAMDKVPMFADRGAILSLEPYITPEYKNELYPVVLQALSYNGSVYAVARDVSSRVMYFNKAMFDAAAVPIPDANWTWEDFRALAKKLTKVEGNQPVQWGFYFPKFNDGFFHWLRQADGGLVSEDGTKSALSKPESLEALHFLQDMIVKDKSIPTESQAQQFGTNDLAPFMAGKVAMLAGSLSTTTSLTKDNVEFAVRPLPKGKREMNTAFVNAWAIPKGAKDPKLSWRVLQFFSSKDGQQIVLDTGLGLPASKGVDTAAFLKQHPDSHFFVDAMATAEPFPCPLYGVDFFNLVQKEFDLMWLGQRTPEEAVAIIEKTGNDILSGKK